jgi:hypothetical protein
MSVLELLELLHCIAAVGFLRIASRKAPVNIRYFTRGNDQTKYHLSGRPCFRHFLRVSPGTRYRAADPSIHLGSIFESNIQSAAGLTHPLYSPEKRGGRFRSLRRRRKLGLRCNCYGVFRRHAAINAGSCAQDRCRRAKRCKPVKPAKANDQ